MERGGDPLRNTAPPVRETWLDASLEDWHVDDVVVDFHSRKSEDWPVDYVGHTTPDLSPATLDPSGNLGGRRNRAIDQLACSIDRKCMGPIIRH